MERERKEQDETLKKQHQPEIEDYEYQKALERKKAQAQIRRRDAPRGEKEPGASGGSGERLGTARGGAEGRRGRTDAYTERGGKFSCARLQNEAETAALRVRRRLKKDAETERRLAELQVRTLG
jgi:hypothetical protein